jgi:S1-C subfamily serine protease
MRGFLSTRFGSAVAGGLVVLVFGWIGLETGLIDAGDEEAATSQPPLARPVAESNGDAMSVNEIYQRDAQGVVFIQADVRQQSSSPFDLFPQQEQTASGSGFVIDEEGHVLTNAHVVSDASQIRVTIDEDSEPVTAELVGADPSTDIALLKIDAGDVKPLSLGEASSVEVGDPVVAIGNPFGLERTVTTGIVSALQREIQAPNGFSITNVLQTDASINPGSSGGPLLDASGRVVGINSQIATGGGGGSVGVGFAVPIDTAREVVDELLDEGKVHNAYLGITGTDLNAELARALDLEVERGVLVQEAPVGGPAEEAGVRGGDTQATIGQEPVALGGDIIVKLDGEDVSGMEEVIAKVEEKEPGETLTLTLLREGEETEVEVTLGQRPAQIGGASESNAPLPFGQ